MERAERSSEVENSKATADDGEMENGPEDDVQENFEMKPIETLEHEPSMDSVEENANLVSRTSSEEDLEANLENEDSVEGPVKSAMNDEVIEGKEASNSSSLQQQSGRLGTRTRILIVLSRCSLFAIGLAVLVLGGVSSIFTPYYVEPWEYDNCTVTWYME